MFQRQVVDKLPKLARLKWTTMSNNSNNSYSGLQLVISIVFVGQLGAG